MSLKWKEFNMSRMSNIDYTTQTILKTLKDVSIYIVVAIVIIVIAILIHGQSSMEEKKYKDKIYNLKVEIDSLRETIDYYERKQQ